MFPGRHVRIFCEKEIHGRSMVEKMEGIHVRGGFPSHLSTFSPALEGSYVYISPPPISVANSSSRNHGTLVVPFPYSHLHGLLQTTSLLLVKPSYRLGSHNSEP